MADLYKTNWPGWWTSTATLPTPIPKGNNIMQVTISDPPPVPAREVTIVMSEDEANILRIIAGYTPSASYSEWANVSKCTTTEVSSFVSRLYYKLGNVVPAKSATI